MSDFGVDYTTTIIHAQNVTMTYKIQQQQQHISVGLADYTYQHAHDAHTSSIKC